ncbi:uncharacterized protein LY89DRAFT_732095 [Mollisia scopiformis]|uniref:Uncharacterized protein n=1 Tax=Mollisia scopiformis TaxID=149040 RepID=A0A194XEG5_MOLSC|nr:uncharacterized protein LY89DRAFT_732095 [Mollisia scopiformis]KUJ18536.1 hypothetical protein LY89DRAFT_732095 [Mollisia scopiformis]
MKAIFNSIACCILLFSSGSFANNVFGRQVASSSVVVALNTTSSVPPASTPTVAPSVNGSEHDLPLHFCRLWRHASVYAEGKIYIDSGNTYIPNGNTTFYNTAVGDFIQGMNDVLVVLDLSRNFTNNDTSVYSVIDKGPGVPNALIESSLWYSKATRKIYQLGGWFSYNNEDDPGYAPDSQIPASSIWEFDIDLKSWAQSALSYINTGMKVDRPGAAAHCDAPSLNKSFLFEGYVQHRSDPDYLGFTVASMFKFLEGMLLLDTNTFPPTLTNISVPNYIGPRMNGAMVHIPVGEQGIIVQIGGQTTTSPTPFGVPIVNANEYNSMINNTMVDIYDVQTGYWFQQATFGIPDIPYARSDICTVVVVAPDNSSYNIFMIGGVQAYTSVIPFEEMWVLTMPTFQWVKVYSRPNGLWGHTCHAVGENLLVIGGMQMTSNGGNDNNCSAQMPADIFNLVQMDYTGQFDLAGASRPAPIPADVVALIGGNATGGALVTTPASWSDPYVQYIFNQSLVRPAYTPTYTLANTTASPTARSTTTASPTPLGANKAVSHIGAIVGAVIGGLIILALLIATIVILRKRRSANKASMKSAEARPEMVQSPGSELPGYEFNDPNSAEVAAAHTSYASTGQPESRLDREEAAEMDAE